MPDFRKVYTVLKQVRLNGSEKSVLVDSCSKYFQQRSQVYLTGCDEITDGDSEIIIEALKSNTTITNLQFAFFETWELHQQIAQLVESNTNIVKLTLSDNKIDDVGCIAIANSMKTNTTITNLWMYKNNIKCKGAKALAGCLKVNNALKTLYLNENGIRNDGAVAIASALAVNTSLESLNLSNNKLGDKFAIRMACALVRNKTLKFLKLKNTTVLESKVAGLSLALFEHLIKLSGIAIYVIIKRLTMIS